jgi:uncharacterized membrane protein YkoI
MTLRIAVMVALALTPGAPTERRIQMRDVPTIVRAAIEAQTRDSTLKGVSKETEHGQTFYEAETVRDGRTRDLLFDASGKLVEVEEEIMLSSAPTAVQSALEGKGHLVKLESVTTGSVVTYEAHVSRNGKTLEIALDASGKQVKN